MSSSLEFETPRHPENVASMIIVGNQSVAVPISGLMNCDHICVDKRPENVYTSDIVLTNARDLVYQATKAGRLVRGPCTRCGSTVGVEGHHEDYHKALEVIWLCRPCHWALHRERKDMARSGAHAHFRVPDEEKEAWRVEARKANLSLSEWIREKCNSERAEDHRAKELPRPKQVLAAKRSSGVSRSVSTPGQAGRKCLCGDTWEEHWEGGRCQAERCKCDKFEEA